MTATPLKTFIIYARADAAFKDELLNHLHLFVENRLIEKWVDSDLLPGEDWEKRIEQELEAAHLVIMLVSADALSSEFIRKKELKTAIEKKRAGSARFVPVLVRDCMWKLNPDIAEIQLLPRGDNGRIQGVAAWLSRDSAWTNVCEELHKLIQEIHAHLEKEKAAAERARKAEEEDRQRQEAAEKAARALRRRDEAFWKKISEDATRSDDPQHQIELYESYLQDDAFSLHRAEAEEAIETIQAEIEAAERLEVARRTAEEKRKAAEAEHKKRAAEAAEQKRKEAAEREAEAARIAAEAKEREERHRKEEAQRQAKEKEEQKRREEAVQAFIEMVPVEGGPFQFGGEHTVTVPDFEIGKYPVTQKQWREIMGNNPSRFKGDDLPVESVNWDDVKAFIQKLNERFPGRHFRLPSEAEWEYAARGGRLSKGYEYAGSNKLDEVGWYWENSGDKPLSGEWDRKKIEKNNCRTHPVGHIKANELGIHDMSGNVWEWCADDWHADYKGAPTDGSAWVDSPQRGSFRVLRGGSWGDFAGDCRVSYRGSFSPGYRGDACGFRVALVP
ncbi:MAG TPA: SUMF1/EgtB/PvdO family nonheme iron enzyme [Saprospiraceae bacterium]|nr:SUMF1/EgtB/PvdO family nonheme iron enzyme [Saprospiraceae bacterium]